MSRIEKIRSLLTDSPDDIFLNYSLAMELTKGSDVSAARQQFARVRELDPHYVPAYFQEGQYLAGKEETEAARQILRQGIITAQKTGDSHALGEMTEFLESL